MTLKNGDIYIGTWKNDNKDGNGILWEKDGGIYSGKWKNN